MSDDRDTVSVDRGSRPPAPPDLDWIEPGFALGARPLEAQRIAVRELGVDTVITLHDPEPGEAEAWESLDVQFLAHPIKDWVVIPADDMHSIVEAVLTHRASGRTVLLHCLAGVNRAATLASAVLCYRDGLTVEEAVNTVRAVRPRASPTYHQVRSLRSWVFRVQRAAAEDQA